MHGDTNIKMLLWSVQMHVSSVLLMITNYITNYDLIPENPEGFQRHFLNNHVRWCCTSTEQYYQKSFVNPSTILEATAAGKVN